VYTDGLVADGDTPLCQKIFHISEAQAKSVIKPNGMTDNFMGKSISAITGHVGEASILGPLNQHG
jgi:hypothetical protein